MKNNDVGFKDIVVNGIELNNIPYKNNYVYIDMPIDKIRTPKAAIYKQIYYLNGQTLYNALPEIVLIDNKRYYKTIIKDDYSFSLIEC